MAPSAPQPVSNAPIQPMSSRGGSGLPPRSGLSGGAALPEMPRLGGPSSSGSGRQSLGGMGGGASYGGYSNYGGDMGGGNNYSSFAEYEQATSSSAGPRHSMGGGGGGMGNTRGLQSGSGARGSTLRR
jgi:hypothetical protein